MNNGCMACQMAAYRRIEFTLAARVITMGRRLGGPHPQVMRARGTVAEQEGPAVDGLELNVWTKNK
jgi:hypothetical protein